MSGLFVPKSTRYRQNEQGDSESDETPIQHKSSAAAELQGNDYSGYWGIKPF